MNTFEFQIPRNIESNLSQEDVGVSAAAQAINPGGAPPTGWSGTTNPIDLKNAKSGGLKVRVIGTGQMVSTLASNTATSKQGNAITNQIGYTYFSFGNVKPAIGLAKYLLVDGVDPLFDGAAGPNQNPGGTGALPSCTAPCPTAVTLTNMENGSYPIWNILRVLTTGTLGANTNGVCNSGATVCQLVANAQTTISQIPDFAPLSAMQVFRSHYNLTLNGVVFAGHNGHSPRFAESGGDVEGAVLTVQSDLDSVTDTNAEEVNLKQ
jgi:hypothetical protein